MNQKTKRRKLLPRKLSALILVALADLAKAERSRKKYRVGMAVWHSPNSHCTVCFAGSVMAFSLGSDPKRDVFPRNFGPRTERALLALDSARRGRLQEALSFLRNGNEYGSLGDEGETVGKVREEVCDIFWPSYDRSPVEWKKTMRLTAKKLAEVGL